MKAVFIFDNHNPYLPLRMRLVLSALRRVAKGGEPSLKLVLLGKVFASYGFDADQLDELYAPVSVQYLAEDFRRRGKLKSAVKLLRWLISERPDIVFLQGYDRPENLLALFANRLFGVPTICIANSKFDDSEHGERSPAKEWLKSLVVRQCAAIGVPNRDHAQYLQFLATAKVQVDYPAWNLIDTIGLREDASRPMDDGELRRLAGVDGQAERFFISPTRFMRKKNFEGLLDGYQRYVACAHKYEAEPIRLVLCGQGPYEASLLQEIATRDLSRYVIVRSWVEYRRLPALYRRAEALVLASWYDQWGNTVSEALASGCCVLVSSGCGARRVVKNGINGYTFDPDDSETLGEQFWQLHVDRRIRDQVRANPGLGLERMGERDFEDCYTRLLTCALKGRRTLA